MIAKGRERFVLFGIHRWGEGPRKNAQKKIAFKLYLAFQNE